MPNVADAARAATADGMDSLSEREFRKLAALVEDHAGIRLPPVKKTMLEGRLRKRVRALGLSGLGEYCSALFSQGSIDAELIHLIDVVTTNKTDFFREPDHFDFLRDVAVPRLLAGRSGPLKIWSAASSIGAEPYTIAMVLAELAVGPYPALSFTILGSDISTEALRQAAMAIYPEEMVEPVPPVLRRRYVMRSRDPERREVRIAPELRRTVQYRRLNLMDASYPVDHDFDVIFCRNVLIYFDRPTQRAVIERLCGHLRPSGYLFLGHSESAAGGERRGLRPVAPTIFLREGRAGEPKDE